MSQVKLIVSNWKMNLNISQARVLNIYFIKLINQSPRLSNIKIHLPI